MERINCFRKPVIFLIFFTAASLLGSETPGMLLPENYEVRREFRGVIFGSNSEIEKQKTVFADCFLTGGKVRFQVISSSDSYYFVFINEKKENYTSQYPLVSPGSYIIKRNRNSGAIEQIKIFLNNDSDTFLRIAERGEGSLLEFSLFGSVIYRDIVLPADVETLATEPFERIILLSDYIVDWKILSARYNASENRIVMEMAEKIDKALPLLNDSDDGAQDSSGDFVFIESLTKNKDMGFNCSGFAKWISDGIFYPKTKKLMEINKLKKKNIAERKDTLSLIYEDTRDPLFGLDWTRNIAMSVYEIDFPDAGVTPSSVDVNNYPYENYVDDIGYPLSSLKALLYYLASSDPGYIYLGSVNGDFGSGPVLRQHYHVAVFLPYIDEEGNFHALVYERNRKTDINEFVERYKSEFIHIVKIKGTPEFTLPDIAPAQSAR